MRFKIYGIDGKVEEIEAIADTGATFAKIPRNIASKIGLTPRYEREFEQGDGRTIKRKIAVAEVGVEGEKGTIPIAIGEEGERCVLGYTSLEILGFKVNPVTCKLEKVKAIE